jgi:hypothetical protein
MAKSRLSALACLGSLAFRSQCCTTTTYKGDHSSITDMDAILSFRKARTITRYRIVGGDQQATIRGLKKQLRMARRNQTEGRRSFNPGSETY